MIDSSTPLKAAPGAPGAPGGPGAGGDGGAGVDSDGGRASVRLPAVGLRFITGVSSAYSRRFPPELRGVVPRAAFDRACQRVIGALADYWPCMLCFGCGYACCLCTLGLSFLCPNICIGDAEKYAREELARLNRQPAFEDARVSWALRKRCGTSWIEVSFPAAAAAAAAAARAANGDANGSGAPAAAVTGVPPSAADPQQNVATAI